MKKILLICIVLLSQNMFGQVLQLRRTLGYAKYNPITNIASINKTTVTLSGNDGKVNSNRLDTSATKLAPIRWIVWYNEAGADSFQGKAVDVTGLQPNTQYSYYYALFIMANDGDIDYIRGETRTFTTLGTIPYPEEVVYYNNGEPVYYSDGNYIYYTIQ